jgi:hypothetical protein
VSVNSGPPRELRGQEAVPQPVGEQLALRDQEVRGGRHPVADLRRRPEAEAALIEARTGGCAHVVLDAAG